MNASPDALLSASPVRQTDDWAGGEPKRSMPDSQFALDLLHEFARASTQLNHDASFSGSRFVQIGKLTLKQSWIHEMSAPAPGRSATRAYSPRRKTSFTSAFTWRYRRYASFSAEQARTASSPVATHRLISSRKLSSHGH